MKTDFNVSIHVDLGVTPELTALVMSILSHTPSVEAQPRQPQTKPIKRQVKQPTAEVETTAETAPEPQPEAAAAAANADDGKQPEAKAVQEQKPAEDKPKQLTEQDIREAMHKTRQRIEGENYKEETDGEAYKKYHRQLTATFKNIAALLGADKPSTLPAEQRAAFIAQCEELEILEDGTIGTKVPY